jgi:ribosomal protein S18 acetylase RimI-like enzyme
MESARRATAGDREVILVLARQAIAEVAQGRGGAMWRRVEARSEPLEPGIDAALVATRADAGPDTDGDQLVVVGAIDEAVIGYGIVRVEPLHDGATVGRVTDLYVEPDARGVGVGEAIMDELVAFARSRSCVGVDSIALPGDRHTKNFFERFGLTARAIIVHRSFVEADGPHEPAAPAESAEPAAVAEEAEAMP